jgi:hypothetical protein
VWLKEKEVTNENVKNPTGILCLKVLQPAQATQKAKYTENMYPLCSPKYK